MKRSCLLAPPYLPKGYECQRRYYTSLYRVALFYESILQVYRLESKWPQTDLYRPSVPVCLLFCFFLIPGVPFIYSFTHFVFYFLLCLFFYLSYSIFLCVFLLQSPSAATRLGRQDGQMISLPPCFYYLALYGMCDRVRLVSPVHLFVLVSGCCCGCCRRMDQSCASLHVQSKGLLRPPINRKWSIGQIQIEIHQNQAHQDKQANIPVFFLEEKERDRFIFLFLKNTGRKGDCQTSQDGGRNVFQSHH